VNERVTYLLVTYHSARILSRALPPLAGTPHVVVVDNGSSDDTVEVIRRLLPQARLVEAGTNLGFGRANNLGLAQVRTPFALLLNPDCVLAPGALEELVAAAERYPDAAIVGPKLFDAPGVPSLSFRRAFYERQPKGVAEADGDLCADFLTGTAMLLNMAVMRRIGFFDPWFFLYFEDDDLCLRVRRAGGSLVLAAHAVGEHLVQQSSPASPRNRFRRVYCHTLSKIYIERKYLGRRRAAGTWLRIGIGSLISLPIYMLALQRDRVWRTVARLWACLRAPARLRAAHCMPDDGP
jgi:GT2 family glycosyltransferase